jgi:hypothetical protein
LLHEKVVSYNRIKVALRKLVLSWLPVFNPDLIDVVALVVVYFLAINKCELGRTGLCILTGYSADLERRLFG